METVEELPQHELIVLRDIHVSGGSTNHAVVRQLICDGMDYIKKATIER